MRGTRGCTGVEAELAAGLETLFTPAQPTPSEVNSSGLEAMAHRGDDVSAWCPRRMAERLIRHPD